MDTLTSPTRTDPGTGSPDDHSHYADRSEITRAAVEGGLITALCGVKFAPIRDPNRFPICPQCKHFYEMLTSLFGPGENH